MTEIDPPTSRATLAPDELADQPPPPQPRASPEPRSYFERDERPVARLDEVLTVLAAGFFGNLVLRSSAASVAATIGVVLVATALWFGGRLEQRVARVLVVGAVLLAPWLTIRSTPALTAITVITIAGLLAVAVGMSRSGSLFDMRVRQLLGHTGVLFYEWTFGLAMIQRLVGRPATEKKLVPILRGVIVTAPVIFVFASLLAAADDVFASVLLMGDLPSIVGHLVLSLFVGVACFALVSRSAHDTTRQMSVDLRLLGPVEVLMILGGLVMLFSGFVLTQVIVAVGGADHVLETEGLTAADHARRGFFQLLWVAGLATALVGSLRAVRISTPDHARDRFTPLALLTLGLTLVIALISMQRLWLYIGSFGLTPLRLWALVGAGTIAVLVAMFAVSIAGWHAGRSWFPGVAFLTGIAVVLGLNVLNPDAFVARFNIESPPDVGLDAHALSELDDDAVATMVELLDELEVDDRSVLVTQLCRRADRETSFGPFEYNRASVDADRILDELCLERTR